MTDKRSEAGGQPDGRGCYLSTLDLSRLDHACRPLVEKLGIPYLVGSVNKRHDYRDVDVRLILVDAEFDAVFGENPGLWELFCIGITSWLRQVTDLPVDFQVQRMTEANENYPGESRNPLGLGGRRFARLGDATRFLPAPQPEDKCAECDHENTMHDGRYSRCDVDDCPPHRYRRKVQP